MRLTLCKNSPCLHAAQRVRQRMQAAQETTGKPFVLGLPTGGTVLEMYAELVRLHQNGQLSFANAVSFNMDEYVGLPPTHPESYHAYMAKNLFSKTDFKAQNTHILDGMAADLPKECDGYETQIASAGGIDLFLGGVGENGHIAFNEPGSAFDTRTRVVTLTPSTIAANSRFFNDDLSQVPTQALSVGIGTVLNAREVLFLACGARKAEAVHQLAQGAQSTAWPVTALQTHPNATMLVDAGAASKLDGAVGDKLRALQAASPNAPEWTLEF